MQVNAPIRIPADSDKTNIIPGVDLELNDLIIVGVTVAPLLYYTSFSGKYIYLLAFIPIAIFDYLFVIKKDKEKVPRWQKIVNKLLFRGVKKQYESIPQTINEPKVEVVEYVLPKEKTKTNTKY